MLGDDHVTAPDQGLEPSAGPPRPSQSDVWRRRLTRILVILGPLGLGANVLCSLWIFQLNPGDRLDVQLESQWQPNAPVAVRAAARGRDGRPLRLPDFAVEVVDGEGRRQVLGSLSSRAGGLVSQANLRAPAWAPGRLRLQLSPVDEAAHGLRFGRRDVDVELRAVPESRGGSIWVAAADQAKAEAARRQPKAARIDLWPAGRLLAGFANQLWIRTADKSGKAQPFHYQVELVAGEFAGRRGTSTKPVVVGHGTSDSVGLAELRGNLGSEAARFRVSVCTTACGEGRAPLARREFYMPSLPGGIRLSTQSRIVAPGDTVFIQSETMSAKRPVFVDIHRPNGRWAATIEQLVAPGTHSVSYRVPQDASPGLWQFEGDHSGRGGGPNTALARVWVRDSAGTAKAGVRALIALHRQWLANSKLDKRSEADRVHMLDDIAAAALREPWPPATVERLEGFLLDTLPLRIYGAPQSIDTLAPARAALEARKARWTLGLRVYMTLGGFAFVAVFASLVWLNYRGLERSTAELCDEDLAFDEAQGSVLIGRRALLVRGTFATALVAGSIVLLISMMERFIWLS